MEATVVCVDNSEHTRNGDYAPTRFQAQADAVNLLAGAKTQHHPENAVGVLTMAGAAPQVLVTPTPDLGKVLNAMAGVRLGGECRLATSVQIAQLALKHRENKNQRQRVVLFVGSPVAESADELVKIARRLKKNNVSVDVVAFGSEAENAGKLEAFHAAVDSNGTSHLVTVPPGTILSDALFGTPIFMEPGADGGAGGGGEPAAPRANVVDGFDYGALGVDPTTDPELALALRVSMEEERARQAAAAAAAGGGDAPAAEGGAAAGGGEAMAVDGMDEDALLQQALALSMSQQDGGGGGGGAGGATPAPAGGAAATPAAPAKDAGAPPPADAAMAGADEEEDPELALALQMSMAEAQPGDGGGGDAAPEGEGK